jgi:DNA adenine methylase
VLSAVNFFIRARQSRAGTFKGFTSLTRSRTRRGINGNASEWLGAVEGLPAVHARLIPVVLENIPAVNLIPREDTPDTLYYCDPPYLHETRSTKDSYAHEMTEDDHKELLHVLAGIKGKFLLSGYYSTLYDDAASRHGWKCHEFDLPNHAAGGKTKRRMTECVWCNF